MSDGKKKYHIFSTEEMEEFLKTVEEQKNKSGVVDWIGIGQLFGKTSKQCRDTYLYNKDKNEKPMTEEEDRRLLELRKEYGPKWSMISERYFGGKRSYIKLRIRYDSIIKQQNRKQQNRKQQSQQVLQTQIQDAITNLEDFSIFNGFSLQ